MYLIVVLFLCLSSYAQQELEPKNARNDYFKKEEIVFDDKLYRIHNNYLTGGFGFMASNIRKDVQKTIGVDFQFPIRNHHFQIGAMMSGDQFNSNNTIQGHVCYGLRKEDTKTNIAVYIGPSIFTGVKGDATGDPEFYQGMGGYVSFQVVIKIKYDIGIGAEAFGEVNYAQRVAGIKLVAFFSSAYRGPKRNYNPNVRAENPR